MRAPLPWGGGWSRKRCSCHESLAATQLLGILYFIPVRPNSNSAEFHTLVVLNYSCCGAGIELAIGSLPYPSKSGFPIASPGRDRPLSGFPICKPCLDVRQNPSRDTHFPSYGRCPLPKTKPKLNQNCTYYMAIYFFRKLKR